MEKEQDNENRILARNTNMKSNPGSIVAYSISCPSYTYFDKRRISPAATCGSETSTGLDAVVVVSITHVMSYGK
jgi:hypothetical protein